MNYRLELEMNKQKRKMIEFQYKAVKEQIKALQKAEQQLVDEYSKLLDEGQRLAEENDEQSLPFIKTQYSNENRANHRRQTAD